MIPCLSDSPRDARQSWVLLVNASHALLNTADHGSLAGWFTAQPKAPCWDWTCWLVQSQHQHQHPNIRCHLKTWPCINMATVCVPSLLFSSQVHKDTKLREVGGGIGVERNRVWADGVRIKVEWIDAAARTCQQWQMDVSKMKQVRH